VFPVDRRAAPKRSQKTSWSFVFYRFEVFASLTNGADEPDRQFMKPVLVPQFDRLLLVLETADRDAEIRYLIREWRATNRSGCWTTGDFATGMAIARAFLCLVCPDGSRVKKKRLAPQEPPARYTPRPCSELS
jgi:hypothetical protein